MEGQVKKPKSIVYGIFAYSPVVAIIMDMLPIISQMAMFRAMPGLRALLPTWNMHERFTRELLKLIGKMLEGAKTSITAAQLLAQTTLYDQRAPLSGSVVLSALLGSPFVPGDLDYIMRQNGTQPGPAQVTGISPSSYQRRSGIWRSEVYDCASREHIHNVLNVDVSCGTYSPVDDCYPKPHPLVQCICIKDNEPEEHIRKRFDLAFLCNAYDSYRLVVMHPWAVLRRESMLDVARYCSGMDDDDDNDIALSHWQERYRRYAQERGFLIYPMIGLSDEEIAQLYQGNIQRVRDWKRNVFPRIADACDPFYLPHPGTLIQDPVM